MNFSNLHRPEFIRQLTTGTFDLLVIGGGITGCGVALDAALRGMKVALVEQNDFSSGTSSRSTKLIHGGLRYLKQLELKLVFDVGREREVVHRNARHLVTPEKMLLPITSDGTMNKPQVAFGLFLYDLLAGVKRSEWKKMLDKNETHKVEPLLAKERLTGGGLYYEYKTDDARLTMEVAKSAQTNGALLLNYAEQSEFIYDEKEKINGARIKDKLSGQEFEVKANIIVNACGAWVDLLRKKDNSLEGKRLQLTKGVHIVFAREKLPVRQALYFDCGDGRMIFAIPRGRVTYVGTTDTVYNQELDKPVCNKEDAAYLLKAVNKVFPTVHLEVKDIQSSWAGLRPLIYEEGKSPSELSRKDEIIISSSGLVSIAGGKLTGYRLMSQKIVDLVLKRTGKKFIKSSTLNFRISGGEFENEVEFEAYRNKLDLTWRADNIPAAQLLEWFHRYGKNMEVIIENVRSLRSAISNTQLLFDTAELQYGIQHEMVYHLNDFLARRTGKLFFDRTNTEKQIEPLADFIATQFKSGYSKQEIVNAAKEEFHSAVAFL